MEDIFLNYIINLYIYENRTFISFIHLFVDLDMYINSGVIMVPYSSNNLHVY